MVTPNPNSRKFLCSAPRPDQYAAYAKAVWGQKKHLTRVVVEQALQATQARHDIHPRDGPGRKSNAEHALHFYEYLLEQMNEEEEEDDDDDDEEDEQEEEDHESLDEHDTPTLQPRSRTNKASAASTSTSQNYDETSCDVCEEEGDDTMLSCMSCQLVYHLRCVRPIEQSMPSDNYVCAYCILQQEPKHTKVRKVAAAAVRLMARIRNSHKRAAGRKVIKLLNRVTTTTTPKDETNDAEQDDDEDDDDVVVEEEKEGQKPAAKLEGGSESETKRTEEVLGVVARRYQASESTDGDNDPAEAPSTPTSSNASPKRRSLALYKLQDSLSPSLKLDTTGKSKRERKQPRQYDPQNVPARKWQSDEPLVLRKDDDDDSLSAHSAASEKVDKPAKASPRKMPMQTADKDTAKSIQRLRRAHRERGNGVWCHFCGDDPAIKICCFCACRVCFGKQRQSKMLLCDTCDDEYHTFCLDPPLDKLPTADKWFCPSCKASQEKRTARTSSRTRVKTAPSKTEDSLRRSPSRSVSPNKRLDNDQPVKRGPGRPRGRPIKRKSSSPTAAGRKRGRPPRLSIESTEPPRKRGRPPKSSKSPSLSRKSSSSSLPAAESGRRSEFMDRGDFKSPSNSLPHSGLSVSGESEASIAVTVSRSGRAVKRSQFHDEIKIGEQHLRASTGSTDRQRKAPPSVDALRPSPSERSAGRSPPGSGAISGLAENLVPPTTLAPIPGGEAVGAVAVDPVVDYTAAFVPVVLAASAAVQGVVNVQTAASHASGTPGFDSSALSMPGVSTRLPVVTNTGTVTGAPDSETASQTDANKAPRRKPGARECMQMSRRFGPHVIPDSQMEILLDYCKRGKVEHLIRMRERLDDHSRFLESQLAGLEALVQEKGESDVIVPALPSPVDDGRF